MAGFTGQVVLWLMDRSSMSYLIDHGNPINITH